MRRFLAVFAVFGVFAFTFIPASTAQAVSSPVLTVDTPDFTPSPTKWREYTLNITSNMLRGATGGRADLTGSWRAEHIANQYRYAPTAEQLNRMVGYGQQFNPNFASNPSSYEDYMLKNSTRATSNGTTLRVQATPAQRFVRGVGVGGSALSLMALVPVIGGGGSDIIGGWMGIDDVQSSWCSAMPELSDSSLGEQVLYRGLDILSGRMCAFGDFDPLYVPNSDLEAQITGSAGGFTFRGIASPADASYFVYCYSGSPNIQPNQTLALRAQAGHFVMEGDGLPWWGNGPCAKSFGVGWFTYAAGIPSPILYLLDSTGDIVEQMTETLPSAQRHQECIVTLDDGTELSATGAAYDEAEGALVPAPCPSVPPGATATGVTVTEHVGEGAAAESNVLYDEPTTDEYQYWSTTYPECAEGACALDLIVKSGPNTGLSCFDLAEGCPDWFQDPDKADNYECRYGVNSVELDECTIYAGLFKPGRVEVGGAYSDPLTGEWSGGSNSPSLDRQAMGQAVQDPAAVRSCNGLFQLNGFDPVGFVLRPIQCALEWAFVPRPLVVEAELVGGEASWEGKPPAVIAQAVGSFALAPGVSGCSKSVTIFSGVFEQTVTPIDVCPGSMARPFADASRVVTAAVMVVLVIVVVRRQIAGMVGYGQGQ